MDLGWNACANNVGQVPYIALSAQLQRGLSGTRKTYLSATPMWTHGNSQGRYLGRREEGVERLP
jgi:hypothetical protein